MNTTGYEALVVDHEAKQLVQCFLVLRTGKVRTASIHVRGQIPLALIVWLKKATSAFPCLHKSKVKVTTYVINKPLKGLRGIS